jgi:hypothetical protein
MTANVGVRYARDTLWLIMNAGRLQAERGQS